MKEGLVSIITPCFNGEKYVSETIESVIAQTYQNWEMIIVDDGSTDNSVQTVEEYLKKDKRLILVQQGNSGSAVARNKGIQQASGQYIALLDADDLWMPDFLEKQIAFMEEKDAVCVSCAYCFIDESSKQTQTVVRPMKIIRENDMLVMNRIGCLSGLYNAQKYGKIFLREELKSMRDDYAYWLDIVKLEGKAYGNPEVLAQYRVLKSSTTGNKKKLIEKQYKFYHEYLKLNPLHSLLNLIRWGVAGVRKFSY